MNTEHCLNRCVKHCLLLPLVIVLILSANADAPGQGPNLVPNPSFEEMVFPTPPYSEDQLSSHCKEWRRGHKGTSDYFVRNSVSNCTSYCGPLPVNAVGKQYPRTGDAYAGVGTFEPDGGVFYWGQEYLAVQLVAALEADMLYEISFFVSLAETSTYGVEDFGAAVMTPAQASTYLGSTQVPGPVISLTPQVTATAAIPMGADDDVNETSDWTLVNGQFIANGGEEWLYIGMFNDPPSTTTTNPCYDDCLGAPCTQQTLDFGRSYHFVDDVSVSQIYRETDPCPCQFGWQESIEFSGTEYDYMPIGRGPWPDSFIHPDDDNLCCLNLSYSFSDIFKLHPGCTKNIKKIRISGDGGSSLFQSISSSDDVEAGFNINENDNTITFGNAGGNFPIDGEHVFASVCGIMNSDSVTGFGIRIELIDEFGQVVCEKLKGFEFECKIPAALQEKSIHIEGGQLSTLSGFVYPNPSTGSFNVVNILDQNLQSIEVRNSIGQIVHSFKPQSAVNPGEVVELDLSNLASGHYIIGLRGADNALVKTLSIVIER